MYDRDFKPVTIHCKKAVTKYFILVICSLYPVLPAFAQQEDWQTVTSPDGNTEIRLWQQGKNGNREVLYNIAYKKQQVIKASTLEIQLDNHLGQLAMALPEDTAARWMGDMELKEVLTSSKDTVWHPLYGERSAVRDHYNQAVFRMEKQSDPDYRLDLIVRVYNEGVAFRYHFPETRSGIYYHITGEHTEFTLPENTMAWYEQWAQGPYARKPLKNWPDESERPLTLELPNGLYACLAEAAMTDYVRMKFALSEDKPNTVVTSLYESVDKITYFNTPWRVVMVAEEPGTLIENNDILLNLNAPNRIKDTGWIKPGKIVRDLSLTDEGAKAWIDFAAEHNLQYVLFDSKWYGPSLTFDSDAGTVDIDLDLQEIITYGKKKNVGIWLYVNQQALLKQDHELFSLYKKWGIAGVKYGFVQLGSHRWTTWLHESVQRAADNELMVNIHDEFRFTGEQRTWPNMLTTEGIRGNEEMPDATHNTILPFTRGIAGAGDYTICYYTDRIKTTHAHQLALGVVMYSPLQTLFWYDKAADYNGEPEIEFFEKLPVTWDETRVIAGKPGACIATARRKGKEWFVGVITNTDKREIKIPFDFLEAGKRYEVTLYQDSDKVNTKTKVALKKIKLTDTSEIDIKLKPSGGAAIWIREL